MLVSYDMVESGRKAMAEVRAYHKKWEPEMNVVVLSCIKLPRERQKLLAIIHKKGYSADDLFHLGQYKTVYELRRRRLRWERKRQVVNYGGWRHIRKMKETTTDELLKSIRTKSRMVRFKDRSYVMLNPFGVAPLVRRGFVGVGRRGEKVYRSVTHGKLRQRYTLVGYDTKTDIYTSKDYKNYQTALKAFKNKVTAFTRVKGKGREE